MSDLVRAACRTCGLEVELHVEDVVEGEGYCSPACRDAMLEHSHNERRTAASDWWDYL